MPITKEWLKSAAISQSFSKGKDYYDQVDDLVKKNPRKSSDSHGFPFYSQSKTFVNNYN